MMALKVLRMQELKREINSKDEYRNRQLIIRIQNCYLFVTSHLIVILGALFLYNVNT